MYIPFDTAESTIMESQPSAGRFSMEHDVRAEAIDRRRIEQDLRQALHLEQFKLYYQPRMSLSTGSAVGAEALLRWPRHKRGIISAASFIAIAERTNLITQIGEWVARTACTEAASWLDDGVVSVNVSGRQLEDGELVDQVVSALRISGLPPHRLELEMSESMLLNVSVDALINLSTLRDLGVGLALDNFGSCHGGLTMLKRLPLTVLKLDRSLTSNLPDDREDAGIVLAITTAAHALGIVVVAEGVETERQRSFLASIGCDDAQGHLFSQALSSAQLRQRLEQ